MVILSLGIDMPPSDVIVLLRDVANFYCTSLGGQLVWVVNGITVHEFRTEYNATVEFSATPRSDGQFGENSTLQISGMEHINNSNISCVTLNEFVSMRTASNHSSLTLGPATLLVQGNISSISL